MKLFEGEDVLFTSKNKQFILTSHRLRNEHKSFWGSVIKSILLTELTGCELRTIVPYKLLRKAFTVPLLINAAVFLVNNMLFKSALLIEMFGEVAIGPDTVLMLFYFSLVIMVIYLALFFLSMNKVMSFYAPNIRVDVDLAWLDFEERESFISRVEQAKLEQTKMTHAK